MKINKIYKILCYFTEHTFLFKNITFRWPLNHCRPSCCLIYQSALERARQITLKKYNNIFFTYTQGVSGLIDQTLKVDSLSCPDSEKCIILYAFVSLHKKDTGCQILQKKQTFLQ